ncbi:hypothetical protein [Lacrimispora saccharolytica]|uniref:hypothetical protein n=1 Tax=Lacrimispora saccharolytica TaxID=84030 RepID=UPI00195A9DE9|nr:hypothetical protein [Lacrimispora saccharolytica]QRV22277.1 hypothetical protein I6K70_09405 [Lacrimispora saccharolytica]
MAEGKSGLDPMVEKMDVNSLHHWIKMKNTEKVRFQDMEPHFLRISMKSKNYREKTGTA